MQRKLLASVCSLTLLLSISVHAENLELKGDNAWKTYDNNSAVNFYLKEYQNRRNDQELLIKIIRGYIDIGEDLEEKKDKGAVEKYKTALKYSQEAVKRFPDKATSHLYLGISIGRMALFAGGTEKVKLSRDVKSSLDKALALDKTNYLTHATLGVYHREIASLNWFMRDFAAKLFGGVPKASFEESADHLKKSVTISPRFVYGYVELGKTYLAMGRKENAIEAFKTALSLPDNDHQDHVYKKEAKELINK